MKHDILTLKKPMEKKKFRLAFNLHKEIKFTYHFKLISNCHVAMFHLVYHN